MQSRLLAPAPLRLPGWSLRSELGRDQPHETRAGRSAAKATSRAARRARRTLRLRCAAGRFASAATLAPSLSPALDGREIAGTSRRSAPKEGDGRWLWRRRYFNANNFYDTGSWYVVAQCWDVLAIAEELERHEELTSEPFDSTPPPSRTSTASSTDTRVPATRPPAPASAGASPPLPRNRGRTESNASANAASGHLALGLGIRSYVAPAPSSSIAAGQLPPAARISGRGGRGSS